MGGTTEAALAGGLLSVGMGGETIKFVDIYLTQRNGCAIDLAHPCPHARMVLDRGRPRYLDRMGYPFVQRPSNFVAHHNGVKRNTSALGCIWSADGCSPPLAEANDSPQLELPLNFGRFISSHSHRRQRSVSPRSAEQYVLVGERPDAAIAPNALDSWFRGSRPNANQLLSNCCAGFPSPNNGTISPASFHRGRYGSADKDNGCFRTNRTARQD
jgi:hypothetical protein